MGNIVFATIVENIKSFFGKEDELLADPKAIPEAASETFEKHGALPKIVEKSLPKDATVNEPKLPFTPGELRNALKETPQQKELPKKEPPKEPEPKAEERDITHEISAFESALLDVHEPPAKERPRKKTTPAVSPVKISAEEGFFDEFEQFILHKDLETEGILDTDILHKMKEFHQHKQEGKEYYIYSTDIKAALQRKLTELKTLEREWFQTRKQMDELERGITGIEQEIEGHASEVKRLLAQAKSKSHLEHCVPEGQEFTLPSGRKLTSLLDLKIALRTMPDDVFHHHVTAKKNDFAAWIGGSLQDKKLAADMAKIRDRHQLDVFLSRLAG